MNERVRIGIAQLELADRDWEFNLRKVLNAADELVTGGADFLVFPELWPSGMWLKNCAEQARINLESVLPELRSFSKTKAVWALWGSMLAREDGKCFNQSVLISPDGKIAADYRKIHLFGLMGEDQYISPGTEMPVRETPFGKIAVAVCYDLRFPELFRYYALSGAEMIFLPAEWPHPRLKHWQNLIRARAIENQIFMISCNRTGKTERYHFFGHSMVVDPWGEVVFEAGEEESVRIVEVNLDKIGEAKGRLNTLRDVSGNVLKRLADLKDSE